MKKLLDRPFSDEKEFKLFVEQQHRELFNELEQLTKEIKNIEWQLMTDEEKENHLKYLRDLKDKFKDEH